VKRFPFAEIFVVVLAVMAIVSSVAAEQAKVTICHKGKTTITVAEPAAAAHYAHGDAPGPCDASPSK
jgi:hypothetical protein